MTVDENDPKVQALAAVLMQRLKIFEGAPWDEGTLRAIGEVIDQTNTEGMHKLGVKLPPLKALVIHRYHQIELFRADLEAEAIERVIVRLARKYPNLTAAELASLIKGAWPDYKPRGVINGALKIFNANGGF